MGTDRTAYGKGKRARSASLADKRAERYEAARSRTVADIGEIDPAILLACVQAITNRDGALRIGLSRDGGAFSFGIYHEGAHNTEYVPGTEDVNAYLRELAEFFSDAGA